MNVEKPTPSLIEELKAHGLVHTTGCTGWPGNRPCTCGADERVQEVIDEMKPPEDVTMPTPITPDLVELRRLYEAANQACDCRFGCECGSLDAKRKFEEVLPVLTPAILAAVEERDRLAKRNDALTGFVTHVERDFSCDIGVGLGHTNCRRCQAKLLLADTLTRSDR